MTDNNAFLKGGEEVTFKETFIFTAKTDATLKYSGHVMINMENFMGPHEQRINKGVEVVIFQGNTCTLKITAKKSS